MQNNEHPNTEPIALVHLQSRPVTLGVLLWIIATMLTIFFAGTSFVYSNLLRSERQLAELGQKSIVLETRYEMIEAQVERISDDIRSSLVKQESTDRSLQESIQQLSTIRAIIRREQLP